MVTEVTPDVAAIFNGHTHQAVLLGRPGPGVEGQDPPDRPDRQLRRVTSARFQLTIDTKTHVGHQPTRPGNVKRTTSLTSRRRPRGRYPRVAAVKTIVDKALADAAVVGNQPVGAVTADITTAFAPATATTPASRDDRGSESTLGNLVADSLRGFAQGAGTRRRRDRRRQPGRPAQRAVLRSRERRDHQLTYAEANAVLPFVNNLWTTVADRRAVQDAPGAAVADQPGRHGSQPRVPAAGPVQERQLHLRRRPRRR